MMATTCGALWRNLRAEPNVDQLIYEIIGHSQLSRTRLPTEPQVPQLQQTRKLLLRLKWVFDSQRVPLLKSSPEQAAPIDRQFLLRIILHVIHLSGSEQSIQERNIDYLVFRRIALETILSAVSLYLLSQSPFTFPEEDLFQSQLQQLVENWRQVQDLSEIDLVLVDKIIPGAIATHQEGDFEGSRSLRVETLENYISINTGKLPSHHLVGEHIRIAITELVEFRGVSDWIVPCLKLYHTITEAHQMLFLVMDQGESLKSVSEYSRPLIQSMPELAKLGEPSGEFARMSQFLLEMLSNGISIVQNIPKQERVFESPLGDRMSRITKAEMMEFDQFYCHRYDRIINEKSSPVLSSPTLVQSERSQEEEYEAVNTPVSKRSSIQAYSPDGPRTSVRSQSPLSMDEILSLQRGNAESSGTTAPLPIPQNSNSVKRKPIPSPETLHNVPEYANNLKRFEQMEIPVEKTSQDLHTVSFETDNQISPISNPETEQIKATETVVQYGSAWRRFDAEPLSTPLPAVVVAKAPAPAPAPVPVPVPVLAPAPAPTPAPAALDSPSPIDDCTLELVTNLTNPHSGTTENENLAMGGSELPLSSPISTFSIEKQAEIEPGLEVAPWSHQDLVKSSAPGQDSLLPNLSKTRVYAQNPPIEPDVISVRHSISSGGSRSKSKFHIFKKLGGSGKRPAVESTPPLPSKLGFCFSMCGQILLLWSKKDCDFLVRISRPFESGEQLNLRMPHESLLSPSSQRKGFSIRFVAANRNLVAALAHEDKEKRLHVIDAVGRQHALRLEEQIPLAMDLTIRPDGRLIAVGFGSCIHVYAITNDELQKTCQLDAQRDSLSGSVRYQRLNFSPDSNKFLSAIQVALDTTPRQAVHVRIWECFGTDLRHEAHLEPVYLTVGYGDDSGISSVFYSATQTPKIFLPASISKSYPAILYQDKQFRNRHLDLVDKRIDSVAQCADTSFAHLFAIQSGRHKIFLLDIRTGVTRQLADLSPERKNMHLGQEAMAIGMDSEDSVYVFWRTANDRLVLRKIKIQGNESTTELVDLTSTVHYPSD